MPQRLPSAATILVVDDEPVVRAFLERALTRAGWHVVTAADGLAALACLAETPVDLVLCDAVMPRMDGLSLCRRLRADPARARLPIVVMSAAADLGLYPPELATAVMRKPMELTDLIAGLASWFAPQAPPCERS